MGKAERDKGKRGERECVKWIEAAGGTAKRTAPMQAGEDGFADVWADVFPVRLDIECKVGKQVPMALYKYILAAVTHRRDGAVPIVYARRDRAEPLIIMRASDFVKVVKA